MVPEFEIFDPLTPIEQSVLTYSLGSHSLCQPPTGTDNYLNEGCPRDPRVDRSPAVNDLGED